MTAGFRALHPRYLATWLVLGAAATVLDQLHARAGITTYPNAEWISQQLPFSPVYAAAGLFGYVAHFALAGLPAGERGFLGGAQLPAPHALRSALEFLAAYALTAILSRRGLEDTAWPVACAAILSAWAAPTLWRLRRTRFPLFLAVVVPGAVGFEWLAVSHGAFAYGICPSLACAGSPVAIVWLPLLYVHAAICVRRLLWGAPAPRTPPD